MTVAGWPGIIVLVGSGILQTFTAVILVNNWTKIKQRYPELRGPVRNPYAAIGQVTFGHRARWLVSCVLFITLYSSFVILILIVTENIGQLLQEFEINLRFPFRITAVAVCMLPAMLFGTPKDFWPIGAAAALASFIGAVFTVTNIIYDGKQARDTVHSDGTKHSPITFERFALGIGTITFAFAGHPLLPTIHADVEEDKNLDKAVAVSFLGVAMLYIPLSIAGYIVYGEELESSILLSLSQGPLLYIAQIAMTIHFLCAFIIIINPVSQDIENTLNIPTDFTWKRCVCRSAIMASAVIIGILVPNFGLIISLVGGSCMVILTLILPILFSYKLRSMDGDWEKRNLCMKTPFFAMIGAGVVVAVLCTYSSVYTIVTALGPHSDDTLSNSTIT